MIENGTSHGAIVAEISRGLVHLHRRFYGRGPTQAKTYALDDTVMCMLAGGFTTVERTLIDDGRSEDVERIRRSFQQAMRERFTGLVEDATGRSVIAYMSQVHTNPDMAVELFVLEPAEEGLVGEREAELLDPA
jgi:uncharacterized protein YbcI